MLDAIRIADASPAQNPSNRAGRKGDRSALAKSRNLLSASIGIRSQNTARHSSHRTPATIRAVDLQAGRKGAAYPSIRPRNLNQNHYQIQNQTPSWKSETNSDSESGSSVPG